MFILNILIIEDEQAIADTLIYACELVLQLPPLIFTRISKHSSKVKQLQSADTKHFVFLPNFIS